MSFEVARLTAADMGRMRDLNALFARVFEDQGSYASALPSEAYLQRVLGREQLIALVAIESEKVIGGLVAYVLEKLEQERSEIYIYDLAVDEGHRRQGIATGLVANLQRIAAETGAWAIYVQADYGDDPAIALYAGLGTREDVMHFDIAPAATR